MMKDSVKNDDMTTGADMESFLEIISWKQPDVNSSNDEATLSLIEGGKKQLQYEQISGAATCKECRAGVAVFGRNAKKKE